MMIIIIIIVQDTLPLHVHGVGYTEDLFQSKPNGNKPRFGGSAWCREITINYYSD